MLLAEAHSFKQQARLAITLAWIAGYTNILTILACGTVTSHVSGTTSNLGHDLVVGLWGAALFAFTLLVLFFAGATISGACTEGGRRRGWESIYVLPIGIEAVLLAAVAVLMELSGQGLAKGSTVVWWMAGLASMSMGLQNATITRISSGVVRTTHVTGVVTDLGLELSQFLYWLWDSRRNAPPSSLSGVYRTMRHHPSPRRLALLVSVFGSFALGAALGTVAHEHFPRFAMFPPVLFLGWIILQDISRPIAEIEPSMLMDAGSGHDLPASLAVFHVRREGGRRGFHRLPDLAHWAERLSADVRVAILDFGGGARVGKGSVDDLRAAMLRFRASGIRLILAGLDDELRTAIEREWGDDLRPGDICPDIEMAMLHGMMAAYGAEGK